MDMRIKALNRFLALATAASVLGTTLHAANVTGRVILEGTPPPEIVVDLSPDPRCAALHTEPLTTRHYVVGADRGLANVFVYIREGVPAGDYPMPSDVPLLDQVDCEYVPYVLGVRVGQTFQVKNSDPTLHNVHATPDRRTGNRGFNFAQPFKGLVSERRFTAPEVAIRFKCDVHPWMFAYVAVVDHPFFSVTDESGRFEIKGLPDGKYTIEAWHVRSHRGGTGLTREIEVKGDTVVDFTIQVP
jgi:hypothetical protein